MLSLRSFNFSWDNKTKQMSKYYYFLKLGQTPQVNVIKLDVLLTRKVLVRYYLERPITSVSQLDHA